jgi:hypothetical protein
MDEFWYALKAFQKKIPNLLVHPVLIILFDINLALTSRRIIRTLSPSPSENLLISVLMAASTAITGVKLKTNHVNPHKWALPDSLVDTIDPTLCIRWKSCSG